MEKNKNNNNNSSNSLVFGRWPQTKISLCFLTKGAFFFLSLSSPAACPDLLAFFDLLVIELCCCWGEHIGDKNKLGRFDGFSIEKLPPKTKTQ